MTWYIEKHRKMLPNTDMKSAKRDCEIQVYVFFVDHLRIIWFNSNIWFQISVKSQIYDVMVKQLWGIHITHISQDLY